MMQKIYSTLLYKFLNNSFINQIRTWDSWLESLPLHWADPVPKNFAAALDLHHHRRHPKEYIVDICGFHNQFCQWDFTRSLLKHRHIYILNWRPFNANLCRKMKDIFRCKVIKMYQNVGRFFGLFWHFT